MDPDSPTPDFETLLAPVLERAFGTALRVTGNRQDAEDLVQEGALNAFRAFKSFEPGTNFKAWFFRILLNCFYTSKRKARATVSMHELEDAHAFFLWERVAEVRPHDWDGDPVRIVFNRLTADDVGRALQALPQDFRVVCTLYFMEDFAYQEIADVLKVPIGTVRSRLHCGRLLLQKQLWLVAQDHGLVPAPVAAQVD